MNRVFAFCIGFVQWLDWQDRTVPRCVWNWIALKKCELVLAHRIRVHRHIRRQREDLEARVASAEAVLKFSEDRCPPLNVDNLSTPAGKKSEPEGPLE